MLGQRLVIFFQFREWPNIQEKPILSFLVHSELTMLWKSNTIYSFSYKNLFFVLFFGDVMNDILDDDTLCFDTEDEITESTPEEDLDKYKLLIVDDEQEIHSMTKLVLDGYRYMGKGLEFISAYTGQEARDLLLQEEEIACCLLDVVMETNHAGLELAKYIREELFNKKIRHYPSHRPARPGPGKGCYSQL